ncbi:MAG: SDR family oxidoreductase [Myxococcaceae bacterium]|nr:SDR family oxidoreductase [Myxococcaceae bacterium]
MRGKTVIITGANAGIGRATAEGLAKQGARVFFACRSREKTLPVIEALKASTGNPELHFLELDLADLAQVKACAGTWRATNERLDVLINNAGLVRVRTLTKQGFEMTFGVNHLGHMLFTLLLEPSLVKAAPARVVVVASRAHERTSQPIDFAAVERPLASYTGWPEYMRSKLANMQFAFALARRWKDQGVNVYALHPGVIASEIWRAAPTPLRQVAMLFMRTPEEGARASLHCASSEAAGRETGLYYDEDGSHRRPSPLAVDEVAQEKLWTWSMERLAPFL